MARSEALIREVACTKTMLVVYLDDGRILCVPLSWFPSLHGASEAQRANWELIGSGEGVHWPELDEDLSLAGMLRGR